MRRSTRALGALNRAGLATAIAVTGALWLVLLERILLLADAESSGSLSGWAVLALVGAQASALLLLLAGGAGVLVLAKALARRRRGVVGRVELWLAGLTTLLTAAPLLALGTALTSGEWIAMQRYAGALRWAVMVVGAPAMGVAAWLALSTATRAAASRPWRRGRRAVLAIVSAAAVAANVLTLSGEYPAYHLFAHGLSLVGTALWGVDLAGKAGPRRVAVSLLGIVLFGLSVAGAVSISPATRAELLLRSPIAATVIRVLIPPDPTSYLSEELAAVEFGPAAPSAEAAVEPSRGREDFNVVIIVVDALRNDAVPPYARRSRFRSVKTPFLTQWAKRAVRFERVYAQASRTHRSMPALFRSLYAYEDAAVQGTAISQYMQESGRATAAVVNNFFIEPRFSAAQHLLEGFELVEVYEKTEMAGMVDQALDAVHQVEDRPFFLWFHVYNMHSPGFDGETLDTGDGSWARRYTRSLAWLDGELARFMAGLEARGLSDRTIVVLAADHGEGLGDNRVSQHGTTVFEEEVRVPLIIDVPGHKAGRVRTTVGNIDIVPTLADLLGLPPTNWHRGHSLVPLMQDDRAPWEGHYYYSENKNAHIVGLVDGTDKLIYDADAGVFMRFDLRGDVTEKENLWDPEGELDRQLLSRLVRRNPSIFRRELENPHTAALLTRKLNEASAASLDESLRFVVRVAALQPNRPIVDASLALFRNSADMGVRLLLLRELWPADPGRWRDALVAHLESLAGTEDELRFVDGLANNGQPAFDADLVAQRLAWWVSHGAPDDSEPWLRLISGWQGAPAQAFIPVFEPLLEQLDAQAPPESTRRHALLLKALEVMDGTDVGHSARIEASVRGLLAAPSPLLQARAARVLGHIGSVGSVDALVGLIRDPQREVRVRQAALLSAVALDEVRAIPLVIEIGEDPLFTADAIKILERLRAAQGLPFLRGVQETHYNSITRKAAARAEKTIVGSD